MAKIVRCPWTGDDPVMIRYHDREWGVPVKNDRKLFEFIILETAQAGLSWRTVLYKRAGYKQAFANFDPVKVARFGRIEERKLLVNPDIIRNRLKIAAAITNARCFLKVKEEFGSFSKYLWRFVDGRPIKNKWRTLSQLPARTELSDKISKDLKGRGFKFMGSTIVYAHLQATGLVNDHLVSCFRYRQV